MKNSKSRHQRKSIRLKDYDYSNSGWYYVTICSYERQNIFGIDKEGKVILGEMGKIVEEEWLKKIELRNNVDLDSYVIMPNHLHGIIIIERRGELNSPQEGNERRMQYAPTDNKFKSPSQTLGAIIRGFKSSVTKRINENIQGLKENIWQRNYYDHIIRNENDLHRIRTYIHNNPLKWELDEYYKN